MSRRAFLKLSAAAGISVLAATYGRTSAGPSRPDHSTDEVKATPAPRGVSLHPFLVAHPEAVFIKRTRVRVKTDAAAKQLAGEALARDIFVPAGSAGTGSPLPRQVAIKANVTGTSGQGSTPQGMGIITDRHFVEGLIEGMKGAGFAAGDLSLREGNWLKDGYGAGDLPASGYLEMAQRTGIHLRDFPTGRDITRMTLDTLEEGTEVIWKDVPQGVVFKRIGYVAPYNQAGTWLLNVAKLKAHGMGMSLSVKNLQGMCVSPHVHFCEGVDKTLAHPPAIRRDFQPDLAEHVAALHAQHLKAGIPRWNRPGRDWNSGYGMEMWAQRTCDSLSVTSPGLCIVEGIYGHNGNGFLKGPGPRGEAQDSMTNVLIFGKDPFRVDMVGTWLAGHAPENFGLYHIAKERELLTVLNPRDIPLYAWEDAGPRRATLSEFERVPLATDYLRRDYRGQREPLYHLVDEG
jgi:uncharacterized protein (DUF362 family)